MASVPEPRGQSVAPQPATLPSLNINAPGASFGAPIAEGLTKTSASLDRASDVLETHADLLEGLANKANSDTAAVQTFQDHNALFDEYATNNQGRNAVPAYATYVAKLNEVRAKNRDTLTNPMARALYDADTRRGEAAVIAKMSSFAKSQQSAYEKDAATTAMATKGEAFAADPYNAAAFHDMDETITQQSRYLAKVNGLDTAEDHSHGDLAAEAARSTYITQAAQSISVTSPPQAQEFLDKYKSLMSPKAYTDASLRLKPALMANEVANDADEAWNSALGRQGAAPVETAADLQSKFPGITITSGVRTPEHNAAVGGVPTSEHQLAFGTAFDMTPPKGTTTAQLAASLRAEYPGAHQVLNEGDHVHIGWKATGASVNSVSGGPATSVQLESHLETALRNADAIADRKYPGLGAYKDQLEQRVLAQANRQITVAKDLESSAFQGLLGSVVAGDGADLHTLLSAPGAAAAYNTLPGSMQKALEGSMKTQADEWNPVRQANAVLMAGKVAAAKAGNPADFLNTDLSTYDLRRTDLLSLAKEQQTLRNKPGVLDPDAKFTAQLTKSPEWHATLSAFGINPPSGDQTKPKNKDNADNYYHLLGAVQDEKAAWQAANSGKVPNAKDVQGILARAGSYMGSYHNTRFGFRTGPSTPNTLADHSPDARTSFAVSDEERAAYISYAAQYGLPTDELAVARAVHGARR